MSIITGKARNKDAFEKTAEQFTKASGFLVKRRRGACKGLGLVTNGTLSSQTEIPRIPNRNFPKFFVNGKRPNSGLIWILHHSSNSQIIEIIPEIKLAIMKLLMHSWEERLTCFDCNVIRSLESGGQDANLSTGRIRSEMVTWTMWIYEEAFSRSNYSENLFSEFPKGSRTHNLPEYRLDVLTTELWRTHGEQGRKQVSYRVTTGNENERREKFGNKRVTFVASVLF